MELPIMLRKNHKRKVSELVEALRTQRRRNEEEIDKLTKRLDEFLPKLSRIKTGYDKDFRTYKLQVAFSDEFIYTGFIHGDSQEMIHLIAMRLSRSIEKELMTINFARFREEF